MGDIVVSLVDWATTALATGRNYRARRSVPHKLGLVVNWFGRRRAGVDAPRLRARSNGVTTTTRVDLAELTPDILSYLGKAAYLQLMIFENLSRVVANAPSTEAKVALGRAAAFSLAKHHGLCTEIERTGTTAAAAMAPHAQEVDRFQRLTQGADWFESVTTCYLTAGFLDDFFLRLAGGLPAAVASRVAAVLSGETGEPLIAAELSSAIEANPRLAARLAMWGRRLVGDTMLIARSALKTSEDRDSDEARIEPVFTELIAAHTRRMDALGLTA